MSNYTGTANDLTALRQALITACTGEGWAWDGVNEVLSKGLLFARLTISSIGISLMGRTSATAGDAPYAVRIGQMFSRSGYPTFEITYPAAYEIFLFAQEVYMVVNYGVDRYQWLAFGQSTVSGLAGTGMWVGASLGSTLVLAAPGYHNAPINISPTGGGEQGGYGEISTGLFWGDGFSVRPQSLGGWVHSGFDGDGWRLGNGTNDQPLGIAPLVPLIGILPNAWNSEAVLLPIRAYKLRPSNKISLVADLEHARYTRVDNYAPGEIITIGSVRWKVLPWHRKNANARNGGVGIDHTGTFGWAIRYEGP